MLTEKRFEVPLRQQEDVVSVRQQVRSLALELGFSLIDQTKVVTAASELARNTVIHGGGGHALLEVLEDRGRHGLRLAFVDSGPGIPDTAKAIQDGFTTGSGLGLGLGGAKRLSSDFAIESQPGLGTRVTIIRWKG